MNATRITATGKSVNFGNGQGLQIPCTILFKREEIYIEFLKKSWTCTLYNLEILSVKYKEYQYYHWNICLSSFFPWKKTSSNSKCNGFICFLLFSISGHWRLKTAPWLFVRSSEDKVGKDKQLAQTLILEAMIMLKKLGSVVCGDWPNNLKLFPKVRNFIGSSGRCYGWTWWPV